MDGANSSMIDNECQFIKNPDYRHCGMFGDPHLRTFSDRLYTCSVVKAWKLIENDHITVMATNFPVEKDSEATVTTQVRNCIIGHFISSENECNYRHYKHFRLLFISAMSMYSIIDSFKRLFLISLVEVDGFNKVY